MNAHVVTRPVGPPDPRGNVKLSPVVCRRRLGNELRQLREARSLRLEDVVVRLGVQPSTLSRIETGQAPTRTSYLAVLLDLYGVDDPDKRRLLADHARAHRHAAVRSAGHAALSGPTRRANRDAREQASPAMSVEASSLLPIVQPTTRTDLAPTGTNLPD
jgi:transcriptional regulator with XRE-family HTH domain